MCSNYYQEVNPLVAASLDSGMWLFLTVKSVGIGVCVAFLTLTKNFRASRLGLGAGLTITAVGARRIVVAVVAATGTRPDKQRTPLPIELKRRFL